MGPRTGYVVHADTDGDQIGFHGQRLGQLLVEEVADTPATDGEVGIRQTGVVRVDDLGEPVGEASQAGGVVAVPESLGLTVTYRHVSGVPGHTATLAANRGYYLRRSGGPRQFAVPIGHGGAACAQDVDDVSDVAGAVSGMTNADGPPRHECVKAAVGVGAEFDHRRDGGGQDATGRVLDRLDAAGRRGVDRGSRTYECADHLGIDVVVVAVDDV